MLHLQCACVNTWESRAMFTYCIMHNVCMQVPDSLCYLVHTRRLDHMCMVTHYDRHMSRRDNHGMTSRSPICMMFRNRSWFSSRLDDYDMSITDISSSVKYDVSSRFIESIYLYYKMSLYYILYLVEKNFAPCGLTNRALHGTLAKLT